MLIAHLDTGYDPSHVTLPEGIRLDLQRNFVAGFPPDDARDRAPAGSLFANRGHGTGTLGILAGNRLDGSAPGWPGYDDYLGAAAQARIMPVRIADWVVRLTTGTMVQGFDYARQKAADVLSMSMGGRTSAALVDAVNLAYDAGIVLVDARRDNNIVLVPTTKSIVFPARYRRVLAACGLMADGRAYAGWQLAPCRAITARPARWRPRSARSRQTFPGRRSTAATSSTWTAPAPRLRPPRSLPPPRSGWPSTGSVSAGIRSLDASRGGAARAVPIGP